MPTASKPKRRSAPVANDASVEDSPASVTPPEGREDVIHVETISPSPINPRQFFDETELQQLAESLKQHGQLQNITVRETASNQYELVGGERRYRAAKLAGLTHLRCRVIVVDDDTAIELRGIENYRRSQLNAIEEAIWFQQMIGTKRFNQSSLAEHLGITPGQVSNRLRLLKLPDDWQRKIMLGRLPPTHARSLIPWADRANVLEALTESLKGVPVLAELSVLEFEKRLLAAAGKLSRSMNDQTWNGPKFKVTEDLLKQLDVAEFPEYIGMQPGRRAFNVELWDRLNDEAKTARDAAAERDDDDDADEGETRSAAASSPARIETHSELNDWKLQGHFQKHFAQSIAAVLKPDAVALKMFLAAMRVEEFTDWMATRDAIEMPEFLDEDDAFAALASVAPKSFPNLVHEFLRDDLGSERGGLNYTLPLLIAVAKALNIDPLANWQPDGPLLELCSTVQLKELFTDDMADPKKLKVWARARTLTEALNNWPPGHLPLLLTPTAITQSRTA